jgi:hypothetical protein
MTDPELFKFDVRVRERMQKRGLSEAELQKHLSGLPDMESACDAIELVQPALGSRGAVPLGDKPAHMHSDDDVEAS